MNINKRIGFFLLYLAFLCSVPAWAGQGWYLIIPHGRKTPEGKYVYDERISTWSQLKSFDTSKECEKTLAEYWLARHIEDKVWQKHLIEKQSESEEWANIYLEYLDTTLLRCIASDDPRLK